MDAPTPSREDLFQVLAAICVQAEGSVRITRKAMAEANGAWLTVFNDIAGDTITISYRPPKAELCKWCKQDMTDDVCFNSKDICIDCCIKAGDPCEHTDSHTRK